MIKKIFISLQEKLSANKWVYWFIGTMTVLIIAQLLHPGQTIDEILFAQYSIVADKIFTWAFIIMMGYLIFLWIQKTRK